MQLFTYLGPLDVLRLSAQKTTSLKLPTEANKLTKLHWWQRWDVIKFVVLQEDDRVWII